MILRSLSIDTIGLKTAATNVQIKNTGEIRIGDSGIEGPGEYDISSVGIHAFAGYGVLFTEGVRFAVIWDTNAKIDAEDETNIDIFVFLIEDAKRINAIIEEQDPRVVVLCQEQLANDVAKQDGATVDHESAYKITASTLPAEARQFVLLAP